MPNGTGKTTTLELLRATLTGEAASWSEKRISELKRNEDEIERGEFICTLLYDSQRVTFELEANFEHSYIEYRTTTDKGINEGHHPPRELLPYLTSDFLELFIFDGEYAERLLNRKHGDAAADKCIETVFQLSHFYTIENKTSNLTKRFMEEEKNRKGFTDSRNSKVQSLLDDIASDEERLNLLKDKLSETKQLRDSQLDELETLKLQHQMLLGKHADNERRISDAEKAVEETTSSHRSLFEEIIPLIKDPLLLAGEIQTKLNKLCVHLDNLKLPEETSKQFFSDLMKEEFCICGRPMDATAIKSIDAQRDQVLGGQNIAVLNKIKLDIQEEIEQPVNLSERLDHLKQALSARDNARSRRDTLFTVLSNESGEEAQNAHTQIESLKRDIQEHETFIRNVEDFPKNIKGRIPSAQIFSIKVLSKRIKEKKQRVQDITSTRDRIAKNEILIKILRQARIVAATNLKNVVVQKCNDRISTILQNDPVLIEDIDKVVVLEKQAGVSVGQGLAIGYTFLTTLLELSQNSFPLVIDSPAGSLDVGVRTELASLVPQVCEQFISFTINTERTAFTDELPKHVNTPIQYLTLFRLADNTEAWLANIDKSKITKSKNGAIVECAEYFNSFSFEGSQNEF
tara:strand:- start:1266 stop:3155 length:1890 start_codon:yes stop_codon:yes gene_type:complete